MRKYALFVMMMGLISAVSYAVPPSIFYVDLPSGPGTGGQDNKGAFVTIVGRNFGVARDTGYVSIGGGQADNYPRWSDNRITFQLGPRAQAGMITVATAGGTSNGVLFTVRAGRIFFVSASSPNDPGSGTFADPWRSPRSYFTVMQPGDICYFRAGTYAGRYGRQSYPYQVNFDDSVPSGGPGTEIAWVGYPGEVAYFQAQGDYPGNFGFYGFGRRYYIVAGLSMYSIGNGRGAVRIFDNNNRLVNCKIEGVKTLSYGMIEVRATQGTKIWGNECFGATSANKLDHILYCQGGASDVDFGWNYVHDNDIAVGPAISINEDGGHDAGTVFKDIRVHDNLIDCRNSSDALRVIGTVDAALGGSLFVYNNIIIEAGSSVTYYDGIYLQSGSAYIYNNTFYRFKGNNSYAVRVNDPAANWHPETVEIKNNIFYNQSNCRYIGLDSTLANVTVDANCYYGGSGNPPSQDTRQVNGDPQFVDAASFNFHLKGTSPCTGKGAAPASFAIRDYDGFVRRPGTTDIGAVQQYVAGASAVTPPTGTYAISGYVNDASSSGIRGVTVALSAGASQVATTAENGFYQFVDLAPESSYTITPSKSNWRFAPAAMNVTLVSESLVNRDFSGTPLATYAISGYLRDAAGAPLSGAAVTISGGKTVTAVTDVSGFYIFPSLAGGESYGVVISKDGFTFTPALRSISALTGDAAAEDFTGIYTAGISPGEVRIIGSTASRGAINPDKGETAKIVYNGSGTGTFECRIFTLTGEMVWQDTRNDSSKGIFEWAPRDIASGVYAVSVKGPGVNARKKVSVIR